MSSFLKIVILSEHSRFNLEFILTRPTSDKSYLSELKNKLLKIIEGVKFNDNRGYFREIYLNKLFSRKKFIFWCMSKSKKNVLRGMHLQTNNTQEKFISVIKGKILDVVVDCRK